MEKSKMADDVDKINENDVKETKDVDRFYSLYSYHQNRDYKSDTDSVASDVSENVNGNFIMSVLSTNLYAAAETDLRKLLSHRLNKGSIYSDEGSMASVEVSVFESELKTQLTCYYCLLENNQEESAVKGQTDQRKYIICFLAQPSDNLEYFKPELDVYSKGILKYLDNEPCTVLSMPKEHGDSTNSQLTNINTSVQSYLQNWYTETLDYICRCQKILQENVKYLLYCALVEAKLHINGCDEKVKNDIQR
ncbi:hypothetical protein KUTeg_003275 [Tegillarca granosa]|uniref:Uncharacterized protein n=1 Tax=Tegillarca granosa TaxID=220873 RepID=A0ABQ9FLP5_TEGGR|nr:hypothetical protein KUTeg_003275 [Tegillarca granosa]